MSVLRAPPARLCQATLAERGDEISRPAYDRSAVGIGIVHLGPGGFHRAHQAVYTDAAITAAGGDWGIAGVCMRSAAARDELAPQDGLYTVVSADNHGERMQVVGALQRVLVAPESPAAVMQQLTDPGVHIVTLTVTEKGYCLGAGGEGIDTAHEDVRHDLAHPQDPRSVPGLLAEALRRRAALRRTLTLLSCDNLGSNGLRLRSAVLGMLAAQSSGSTAWVEDNCRFPCSMVDRIVPAASPALRARVSARIGLEDRACVLTEPFMQWVIEDSFAGPRPAWDAAGALLVKDVEVWENAKLRLLNGPHSAIAYLGALAAFEWVHEAMATPWFAGFIERFMEQEIISVIAAPPGLDLQAYAAALRSRFANGAVPYATAKVASDGSQKIPQRLLPVLRERLRRGLPCDGFVTVLAAWMRHVSGSALDGTRLDVSDPMSARLAAAARLDLSAHERVAAVLAIREIFDRELADNERLAGLLAARLDDIERLGIRRSLESVYADGR